MTDFGSLLPAGVTVGMFIAACLVVLPIAIVIQAAFLLLGAKIVDIEGRSFGKAFAVALLSLIPGIILAIIVNFIPGLGLLLSYVAGFVITAALIVAVFRTSFGKALLASLLWWFFSLIVVGGLVFLAVMIAVALHLFAAA